MRQQVKLDYDDRAWHMSNVKNEHKKSPKTLSLLWCFGTLLVGTTLLVLF